MPDPNPPQNFLNRENKLDEVLGCAIPETEFPRCGQCYGESKNFSGITCHPVCGCCSIWTSPPDSESLAVTHIFKCSHFGYDIRLKTKAGKK